MAAGDDVDVAPPPSAADTARGLEVRRRAVTHVLLDEVDDDTSLDALPDEVEHHLRRVLRLDDGALVTVTDGRGGWRSTRAVVDRSSLRLVPDGPVGVESRREPPVTIASAIPKGERVDVMVQKSTELGVDRLLLLHAERSVVRWARDRADRRRERLQKIADEATRQSRRVWRTSIEGPFEAADVIGGRVGMQASASAGGDPARGPAEPPRPMPIAEPGGRAITSRDRRIAVGPEGGWSDAELSATTERVGIGGNILRIETAVLALSALLVVSNH